MFWAPAVVCEISAPPTTPRGTSLVGARLDDPHTSSAIVIGASLLLVLGHLDLQRRLNGGLVIDLKGGVTDPELLLEQAL